MELPGKKQLRLHTYSMDCQYSPPSPLRKVTRRFCVAVSIGPTGMRGSSDDLFGASLVMREVHSSPVGKGLIDFLYRFSNLNSFFSHYSHLLASPGITICPSPNTSSRLRLLQAGFDYSGRRSPGSLSLSWCTAPGSGNSVIASRCRYGSPAITLPSNPFPQGPGSVLTRHCLISDM